MSAPRSHALFFLGRIVATPGALWVLEEAGADVMALLGRHVSGDWGEMPREDVAENRRSVRHGWRILSSYPVGAERVWIITEADRSSTCILLLEDY